MKITELPILLSLSICATALVLSACDKKEEPARSTTADTTKSMDATATDMKTVGTNLAAEAKKQVGEAKAAVEGVAADSNAQVQPLIDRVKGLVAEKKYTEALSSISELSKLKLTADQQKWLDEIKAQVQKAITDQTASDAVKSAGGLLGK